MKISFLKIILMFAFVFFLSPFIALAGNEHNMSGWAFSSNIGLISFNCTNDNLYSCATHNYGVNQDTYGNLVGYAFSSNIGWIQFGGLSDFPKQQGSSSQNDHNALVVSGKLSGWAKAIGADLDKSDDWDGWISLSGTNPDYGVKIDQITGKFSGYAWGSDVIGIINFDGVTVRATPTGLIPTAGDCGTGTINVKWSPSVGATSYSLKVDGNPIDDTGLTTYTHNNLVAGSSHNYSVQATYISGSSLYSDPPIYQIAPVACSVRGKCSSTHYNCAPGSSSSNESYPTEWTWTCINDNLPSSPCSENKSPGYKEN